MRCGVEVPECEEERPSQCVMNLESLSVTIVGGYESKDHLLCLNHVTGLVLSARSCSQHRIDFVDEHDSGLELARQTEHSADELVAVAIPLLRKSRNVQIDKACARLMRQRLCQHSLSATRRSVQ